MSTSNEQCALTLPHVRSHLYQSTYQYRTYSSKQGRRKERDGGATLPARSRLDLDSRPASVAVSRPGALRRRDRTLDAGRRPPGLGESRRRPPRTAPNRAAAAAEGWGWGMPRVGDSGSGGAGCGLPCADRCGRSRGGRQHRSRRAGRVGRGMGRKAGLRTGTGQVWIERSLFCFFPYICMVYTMYRKKFLQNNGYSVEYH